MRWNVLAAALVVTGLASVQTAFAAQPSDPHHFELNRGDHICLIGNALAERMQHSGWLETLISARYPQHDLVFRNLGYGGDEVNGYRDLHSRMRSMDFGSQDQWLSGEAPIPQPKKLNPDAPVRQNRFEFTNTRADVVFAFYGYNESFAGPAGVAKFKQDLDRFIKHTLAQHYNSKSSPRLVLFSPIAHENLGDRNLLDGVENNRLLKIYTAAMAEVAKADGVAFVDLFTPTLERFSQSSGPKLTINGIHLNDAGDRFVADVAYQGLFGDAAAFDHVRLESLRSAINQKNWYWFVRYRAPDGYSTYGDRAFLRFVGGQTNYEVAQRELEIIDLMTANRDKVVWAAAQGRAINPDDSNLPSFIPVVTNKPGPLPGGKHVFLSGEDEIKKMTVHPGMKVNLFASEEQFPELVNPVQMAFDTRGRLWVSGWHSYPHWKPKDAVDDKLLILEDTDGDGRADKCTVFAGDLRNPTGFEFWNGGVFVAEGPDILFLKDTNGDDHYDVKERVLHGLDTADTHHTSNSFTFDPGGGLYFQEGTFHHTQVETPWGAPRRNANAGVYRYEPRTRKFEVYVTYPFANPHGHVFDAWGQDIVVDGTGAVPYHGPLISSHLDFPQKHPSAPQVYQQRTRPCPGVEILTSRHFPPELNGNLLVPNVIGFQGILQYRLRDKGSSLGAREVEPIVKSSDENFRPADVEIGPDGAIYFTDWHNPIIGHMQHNLRDPSRDRTHGRVYRVTWPGRALETPAPIAGQPIPALLALLKDPDNRVRSRARIELSARPSDEVIAAARTWLQELAQNSQDPERAHHELEALWLFQAENVVEPELLARVLGSPSDSARAGAVRVAAAWQDRLPSILDLLRTAAEDKSPRVRLMAVWAATFVPHPEAAEVVLLAQEHPTDRDLDYLVKEAMRTLAPLVTAAQASHQTIAFKTQAGARYLLRGLSNEELLKRPHDSLVLMEILTRPGMTDAQRQEATAGLAQLGKSDETRVLTEALDRLAANPARADIGVAVDLVRELADRAKKMPAHGDPLDRIIDKSSWPVLRQIAFATLVNRDGSAEGAWSRALANTQTLADFLDAVPLISDPGIRSRLYEQIEPLLTALPKSLGGTPAPVAETGDAKADAAFQIRRAAMRALTHIRGQEGRTFTALGRFIRDDVDRMTAVRAMQTIPRNTWPAAEAGPIANVLLKQIRQTSPRRRTRPDVLDEFVLCEALSTLLPPAEAKSIRGQLRELGVRVVKIGTLFERMSYDQDVIAVQAGKPVEFVLQNSDLMPHNFVIAEPGSLEEIGLLSEKHAQEPTFAARHFVPQSPKILAAAGLLLPREQERLSFNAPTRPGVYPFVCTYPGHWRRMYGALYVVDDLDAYLANPEAYVAKAKLEPRDDLLRDRRPRTEWTPADLAASIEEMSHAGGRKFASGRQLFTLANCVACHRLENKGNVFGPDLTKLDPKWKPADVLNEILVPSAKINEKFQTNLFELASGKTISGLVLEENADTIKIIENPLAKAEPTVLRRGDVLERQRSKTSLMPKGLLDKLTRDEILDLVAYVASGANPEHPLFRSKPDEHGHAHSQGHAHAATD
jgi:putative heme-binding domain-containing protein